MPRYTYIDYKIPAHIKFGLVFCSCSTVLLCSYSVGVTLLLANTLKQSNSTAISTDNSSMFCTVKVSSIYNNVVQGADGRVWGYQYNITIHQSDYSWYYANEVNGCKDSNIKASGLPVELNAKDYTYASGYDRGHLAPKYDGGCSTNVYGNIVPQLVNFNRGAWKTSEEKIRTMYNGHLVYTGCRYDDQHINLPSGKKFYIPIGCYYIVFRDTSGLAPHQESREVLDYGYAPNVENSQFEQKLPLWVMC